MIQPTNTTDEKLKYEGFELGDIIKAYDFEPREWIEKGKFIHRDDFVVGRIIEVNTGQMHRFNNYLIEVIHDNVHEEGMRTEVRVPMEVAFSEFEGRVTKIDEV